MPPPPQFKLANVAKDVLELSHRTNDQIREFEDVDVTSAKLRNVARTVAAKGGSREVAFTVGAGLLAGLGVPGATTLAARGGVRVRVVGTISSPGKGQQVSVTFRIGGGGELKGGVVAGEASFLPGLGAQAAAGLEATHFSTRTYATVDDFIMDAKNFKFAAFEGLGFLPKLLASKLRRLGAGALVKIGRRSDDVKMGNAQYLVSLKARGIAGGLDKVIAGRANLVIVSERKGWTTRAFGEVKGGVKLGDGVFEASGNASIGRERDFKVKWRRYSYVVRTARAAQDVAALDALMHPGPAGGEQILKGLLAKNYAGVNYMLAHLMDEEHAAKTSEIYAKAQVAATGDFERLSRLQEAWQAVNTLPADATPDAKVDAAHRLIVELVRAFRV